MKKSEAYYLKNGRLDLSLLNEEVNVEFEPITYHKIKKTQQTELIDKIEAPQIKESLYGSLETYEILKEMGAYLTADWNEEELEQEEGLELEVAEEEEDALELREGLELEVAEEEEDALELREEQELEVAEEEEDALELRKEQELEIAEEEEDALELREEQALEFPQEELSIQYDELLTLEVTSVDQEIMKQYEKPDVIVEEIEMIPKMPSKVQQFREYQLKLLQGRVLTQDIITEQGVQIGKAGERITTELLERAKVEGVLIKIILKYL
ncbi:MAG: hypothetical protein ACRCTE_01825 [Cellulosilyticaceae bacterium]